MNFRFGPDSTSTRTTFLLCAAAGLTCFLAALAIGVIEGKSVAALSLIGISIALEAQPGAAASIPLGFHPMAGAVISILANLILIPLMMFAFDQILKRWHWIRRKLQKAEKWSVKYGKYGVWVLSVLTPFIGAYLCVAVSHGLGWSPQKTFLSILCGIVVSACLITYGGHFIVSLFHV